MSTRSITIKQGYYSGKEEKQNRNINLRGYSSQAIITPAIKHCRRGHWNHQVLDRVRESGDQSMTGRASGFVTEMS